MNGIKKKLKLLVNNCVMALQSLTWNKDPKIVLFGSWYGEKFADNSRFLFQYLSENKETLGLSRVVWVSRSEDIVTTIRSLGYEAYLMNSDESIRTHKIALYHMICNSADNYGNIKSDILPEYSWRAKKVNLWHGSIGFKNVSMASREYAINKEHHKFLVGVKEFLYRFSIYRKFVELSGGWGDCYYLSNTTTTTDQLIKYFHLPRKNFIEAGTPRVSYSPKMTDKETEILDYIRRFDKVVIYLPTFRSSDSSFNFDSASRSVSDFFKQNNYLWVQKVHSASDNKITNVGNSNILNLPHDFDINLLMPYIDLMVSDYSSAVGEAMYFYKPIIFYVPDYDEYLNGNRGFVANAEEIMCGPKLKKADELRDAISYFFEKEWFPDQKYINVRNDYYGPDRSIEEIWKGIIEGVKN